MNRFNIIAIASFSSLLFLPTADAGIFNQPDHPTPVLVSRDATDRVSTAAEIRQLAQAITVKVLSVHQGGSGILINKVGQTYTILTNAHVVNSKEAYRIQTLDGKTHSAVVISRGDSLKGNDLALLQFQAKENYRVVPLAPTANLSENQEVFAAGFPYDTKELVISRGKISLLSSQPLVGGYQIGYTNEVQQGMSGGPLLNLEGKLIGVNGLLNKAILNDAYVYQNGSLPSTEQLQHIRQLSFAVPIQTIALLASNIADVSPKGQNQQQVSQPPATNNIVDQVNSIAEQITVRIDSKNNGNGSGVIIAHTGQTYYVVTASHVVKNLDSYEIVTPDGQRYALQQENIVKPEGLDAALLQFTSNQTYSVATIAKYNLFNLSNNNWVFLSGFPGNSGGKRKFTAGSLRGKEKVFTRAKDDCDFDCLINHGYDLIYSNLTLPGMSGGPVLNSKGQVIGINAAIENGQSEKVELGLGLGVPSSTLLSVVTLAGLKPELLKIVTTAPKKLTEVEINSLQNHALFTVEKPQQNANEFDWLNYGNQLWRLGRDSEAISALLQAIKLKPDFHQAYYAQGLALFSQKKYDEAVAALDQATKIKPDYYEAWKFKSQVLYSLEKYSSALAAIDEAIKYKNDVVNFYEVRGSMLLELKRYPEAIAALNKAIEIKPLFTSYLVRGAIRRDLKDYQGALFDYNQVLKLQPDYGPAYQGRCLVRKELKDYQGAIADCDTIIKLQPDFASAYFLRGWIRQELKEYQRAIADYSKAIELDPDGNTYRMRGDVRKELEDYQGALFDYNQGIKLEPNNAVSYGNRALFRKLQLKDYQGALLDYNQWIKLQPNNADAYVSRGLFRFVQLKDYQGALFDYNQAIKLQPNNANAYVSRGLFRFVQLKDYQGALFDYNQAIKLQPNNALVYSARGDVRQDLKDYQGALSDYNQAIKLEPNNPMLYYKRGVVHHKLQDYTAALSDYNQAVAKDEKLWSVIAKIGHIKYEKGDVQGAIAQWQQSVKINSNAAEPQMAIAVALYAQGEQQKSLSMAQAALRLDKRYADVAFLKENLWGDRLIADAQKLLSHPSIQAVR